VLEREVAAAQRVFDAIQGRQSQMTLEGSNGQTNIVVLNTATEPSTPSSPNIPVNAVLGAIVGTLAASLVTLLVELSNRKVRGVSDLVNLLHTPVIGYLPSASKAGSRWFRNDANLLYSADNLSLSDKGAGSNNQFGSLR